MNSFIPPARPEISEADIDAAVRVLRSGMVVQGPEVKGFEDEFAAVTGTSHCVAVNSGTSALQLSLIAMGVGPGDEVIVPSFSFAATANAVRLVGAEPIFADIGADSFNIDPDSIASLIGPKTVAIMPVHLYGLPARMDAIQKLADAHGLAILEDAAQAHGAAIDGKAVGSFGIGGCFSFYPTKNMHSLEGGMISTGDAEFARTLRLLRNQGMEQRYANEIVGANMRLTDVAAAVGRRQLTQLDTWTQKRRSNAARFDAELKGVTTPVVPDGYHHVYHQYTIRVEGDRDAIQQGLKDLGIGSAVFYPTPIHRLKPYLAADGSLSRNWDLTETDRAATEVLSLPVFPSLADDEIDRIIAGVNDVVASA